MSWPFTVSVTSMLPRVALDVEECIRDLELLPVRREDIAPLRRRMWGLRHNLTVYDAAYVALAEKLNAALVTCDEKFRRSTGVGCRIETIS